VNFKILLQLEESRVTYLYDDLEKEIYMSQPTGVLDCKKRKYDMQVEEIALWIKPITKAVV